MPIPDLDKLQQTNHRMMWPPCAGQEMSARAIFNAALISPAERGPPATILTREAATNCAVLAWADEVFRQPLGPRRSGAVAVQGWRGAC